MNSINNIIDYNICPYRCDFNSKDAVISKSQVCSILFNSVSKFFFSRVAENKNTSLEHLNSYLNKSWYVLDRSLKSKLSWEEMIVIKTQIPKIFSLLNKSDEIIAINYPTSLNFKEFTINGLIDCLVLRKKDPLKLVVNVFSYEDTNSYFKKLEASYYNLCLKKDLPYTRATVQFNCIISNNKTIRIEKFSPYSLGVENILKDLYIAKKQKLFYPRPSLDNCSQCIYKESCIYGR